MGPMGGSKYRAEKKHRFYWIYYRVVFGYLLRKSNQIIFECVNKGKITNYKLHFKGTDKPISIVLKHVISSFDQSKV